MTVKQYLIHLWYWITSFPMFSENEHSDCGIVGEAEHKCLVCKRVKTYPVYKRRKAKKK